MKKILLIIFLGLSATANIVYDTERKMYYSTNADACFDVNEYHNLASMINILIHEALCENIPLAMMIDNIMDALIDNGSHEALVLYDDLSILWGL